MAAILIFKLFLPWGAPLRLIADQAFNNEEFQQLLEILKIKIRYTSPYNSRSNRSERYCGEVVRMIRTFLVDFGRNVNDKKFFGEAYDYLDFVVAAHNAKPMCHEGISPFEFQHGRPYHWGSDIAFLEDPGFLQGRFEFELMARANLASTMSRKSRVSSMLASPWTRSCYQSKQGRCNGDSLVTSALAPEGVQ